MVRLLILAILLCVTPSAAAEEPRAPFYLHEFLPRVDDLPDGFVLRDDDGRFAAEVVAEFPDPREAEQRFLDAGRRESHHRVFSTPDGSTVLEINAHRFADHEAGSGMASYILDARAESSRLSPLRSNPMGGCSRAAQGEVAPYVDEYTIVLCLGDMVFQVSSMSSATDPEANAVTAAGIIVDRFATLPGSPPPGTVAGPTPMSSRAHRTSATLTNLWETSGALNMHSGHAGTGSDPVPVGESASIGVWRLAVLRVVPDGESEMRFHNPRMDPAGPGLRIVLVEVVVENEGDVERPVSELEFASSSTSAVQRCRDTPPFPLAYGGGDGQAGPGETIQGYLCLMVTESEAGPIDLVVRPLFGIDRSEERHFALR